jgi:hypothetical protein
MLSDLVETAVMVAKASDGLEAFKYQFSQVVILMNAAVDFKKDLIIKKGSESECAAVEHIARQVEGERQKRIHAAKESHKSLERLSLLIAHTRRLMAIGSESSPGYTVLSLSSRADEMATALRRISYILGDAENIINDLFKKIDTVQTEIALMSPNGKRKIRKLLNAKRKKRAEKTCIKKHLRATAGDV